MRITLSRLGLLVGAGAVAVLGFAGTASASPAAPAPSDSNSMTKASANTKSSPVRTRTDVATQAAFNGTCELFELCMFNGNGFTESGIDFPVNFGLDDPTYIDNRFVSAGQGQGEGVADNARSLYNADPYFYVYGCIEENFQGMCAFQPPLSGGDLFPDYFLNLESHRYL